MRWSGRARSQGRETQIICGKNGECPTTRCEPKTPRRNPEIIKITQNFQMQLSFAAPSTVDRNRTGAIDRTGTSARTQPVSPCANRPLEHSTPRCQTGSSGPARRGWISLRRQLPSPVGCGSKPFASAGFTDVVGAPPLTCPPG